MSLPILVFAHAFGVIVNPSPDPLMTDLVPSADVRAVLTPRKDRIEQTLTRLLARDATRSELREAVYQYADLHRAQGLAPEVAVNAIRQVVRRALPAAGSLRTPNDSNAADEKVAMILRWHARRFNPGEVPMGLRDSQRAIAAPNALADYRNIP